jgi:uncharacterized delta-60 repeat protein
MASAAFAHGASRPLLNRLWRSLATALLTGCAVACCTTSHAQIPGSFDVNFGQFGMLPDLAIGTGADQLNALVLQPDGKIVLAGACSNGSDFDFCVARLNPDGTLDASFDGPSGSGNGKFLLTIGAGDDAATAVALQSDGKILLAGTCANGSNFDFCVARLNSDGTLDASLVGPSGGADGRFLLPIGSGNDEAQALAIRPDGKIVLAGLCVGGSNYDFCVARLNSDGTLDVSFVGPSGNADGKFLVPIGTRSDYALALAIQPDGKIVLAGHCWVDVNADFCVARLNPDGTLDTSFNSQAGSAGGSLLLSVGSNTSQAHAVALQPDGKIVLGGRCSNGGDFDFCLARLNSDGTLDTGFDGPSGSGNGKFLLAIRAGNGRGTAIATQNDGKIVLAGHCSENFPKANVCIVRLNSDGTLDASFDGPTGTGDGNVLWAISENYGYPTTVAIQSDGKIVVAGSCTNGGNYDFCIARLNGGPFSARDCTPDFDGDGAVLATTDALILTRVSLGITGNAVINGITFAPHAKRNTWPLIRDYLVAQCGMRLQ